MGEKVRTLTGDYLFSQTIIVFLSTKFSDSRAGEEGFGRPKGRLGKSGGLDRFKVRLGKDLEDLGRLKTRLGKGLEGFCRPKVHLGISRTSF